MASRNATVSIFGWDFQINAAIVLMLDNIDVAERVRVEGDTQDIEVKFNNGGMLYSQAKSVQNSGDFSNVKTKLSSALKTLNDAAMKTDCQKLIYITNSPNPFGIPLSMYAFYGHTRKTFDELPDDCKDMIKSILTSFDNNFLDTDKFSVNVIPFEGKDEREKYKVVKAVIDDFVMSVRPSLAGIGQSIMDIWQKEFFQNATIPNTEKVITKKDLVWPIIVLMSNAIDPNSPILEFLDESDIDEIQSKYKDLINNKCERFDFATKILADYSEYKPKIANKKTFEFIEKCWDKYITEFDIGGMDNVVKEKVIKIIIEKIISQKYLIRDIKKRVNL
jgi:hypothetical protein